MIGAATRSGLARLITAIRATPGAQSRGHRDGGAALWAGLLGRQLHAGGTAMAGWRAPVSAGRSAAAASSLQPVAPESPGSVLVHPPRTHAAPSRSRPASAPVLPSALPGPLGWPAVPCAGVHSWSPPRAGVFGKTGGLAQAAGGLQLLLLAPGGIVQSRGVSTSSPQLASTAPPSKLRVMYDKYGRTTIITYAVLDICTLSGCFVAVKNGIDVQAIFDYIGWGDWYSAGQNGGGAEVGQQASQHSLLTYGPSPETVTQFLIALTLNKLTMPIRLAGIVSIVPKLSQVLKHHFPRFF